MADDKIIWKDGVGLDPKTGKYVVSYYEQGRRRMKRGLPTRKAAKHFKADMERQGAKGGRQETVDHLVERYPRDFLRTKRETTRKWYEERLSKFADDFKGRRLSSVSREEAYRWATENPHRAKAVRAMYTTAANQNLDGLEVSPFKGIGIKTSKGRSERPMLTPEEFAELVKVARLVHGDYGQHFAAVLETFAGTGMRPGELFGLEWQDIDWQAGEIHIRRQYVTKTNTLEEFTKTAAGNRRVPLFPRVMEELRGIDRGEHPYVFHSKTGQRFSATTFRFTWLPVRDAFTAKLPKEHWLPRAVAKDGPRAALDAYELRHYYGSMLAASGATPYDIAELMGHADGGKTAMETYIHTRTDDAIARVRRLVASPEAPAAVSTG